MALGFTWGGFAETGIVPSDFFSNNHTIAVRFLLTYPNAYFGPFFVNGGASRKGVYLAGQGDYSSAEAVALAKAAGATDPKGLSNLVVCIGKKSRTIAINATIRWRHIALVRKGSEIQIFLDGNPKGDPLPKPDVTPEGILVLGRCDFSPPVGRGKHFIGLLDDLVLCNAALSDSQVAISPQPSTSPAQSRICWPALLSATFRLAACLTS